VAQPDAANALWRHGKRVALAHLVGDANLAIGRQLQRELDDSLLDLRVNAVLQQRPAARDLLQRGLAALVVQILEAVEAVARVAHHPTGLADVAELLGQLQDADLGANDLLLLSHGGLLRSGNRMPATTGFALRAGHVTVEPKIDHCQV
jgi:hypothetical protein